MNGFLVVDKPEGITSHDVVALVRAVVGEKKVGHTGTLDPFATGVLALALGTGTRAVEYLDESIKVYDATIQLGSATDTGDLTGEAIRTLPIPTLSRETIDSVLAGFLGDRMQTPPPYSAVKFQGKPLYWYARRGEVVSVPAKPIKVSALTCTDFGDDWLRVSITCSKGTYARVLADEIAAALGTAGHLSKLARTRSGPFMLDRALSIEQLAAYVSAEPGHDWHDVLLKRGPVRLPWKPRQAVRDAVAGHMTSMVDALSHLPLVDLDAAEARRVLHGNLPSRIPGGVAMGGRYLLASGRDVLAIAEASTRGAQLCKVLPQV